jgi:hypothetical protein
MADPIEIGAAIAMIVTSVGGIGVLAMLARGYVKRLNRPTTVPDGDAEALRRSLERLTADVAELHERMDFAERMLVDRAPSRLPES